jgi:hypothetical protein
MIHDIPIIVPAIHEHCGFENIRAGLASAASRGAAADTEETMLPHSSAAANLQTNGANHDDILC